MAISLLLVVGLAATTLAKEDAPKGKRGEMSFKKLDHDFGTINEDDGAVTHTFTFRNTGSAPLAIQSVSTSCGCTASDWSKEPVPPGKEGQITARFNPMGRPYHFSKTLTVRTNGEPEAVTLFIRGEVTPHVKTPEEMYFHRIGEVGVKGSYHSLSKVTNKGEHSTELEVHNFGSQRESITLADYPPYVSVKPETLRVKAGKTASFRVTIHGERVPGYDYHSFRMTAKSGETTRAIHYSFTCLPDFSHIKNPEEAPRVELPQRHAELGQHPKGKTIEHDFVLRNIGKAPLKILKATPSCGCILVDLPEGDIEPGREAKLHLLFNTEGYTGQTHKTVKLILNDPTQPAPELSLMVNLQ